MELAAEPCHGVRRAAAGLSGRAHRRRALLGRRHPLQHADRSDLRRQSAPQLADLRRAHVAPDRRRSRRPSGRSSTARRTSNIRAGSPTTSCASARSHKLRHVITELLNSSPRRRRTTRWCTSSPAMAAARACMWCGCWRRASTTRTTSRTSTSARGHPRALGSGLRRHHARAASAGVARGVRPARGRDPARAAGRAPSPLPKRRWAGPVTAPARSARSSPPNRRGDSWMRAQAYRRSSFLPRRSPSWARWSRSMCSG